MAADLLGSGHGHSKLQHIHQLSVARPLAIFLLLPFTLLLPERTLLFLVLLLLLALLLPDRAWFLSDAGPYCVGIDAVCAWASTLSMYRETDG